MIEKRKKFFVKKIGKLEKRKGWGWVLYKNRDTRSPDLITSLPFEIIRFFSFSKVMRSATDQ